MVREFSKIDQSQIVELQEEFMAEFFPEFADDDRKYEWNADVYSIEDHYIRNGGQAWVAEVKEKIVGFGCLRLVDPSTAEIKRVRINYDYRRKGIGKSIVKQMEKYCASSKITRILVDTDDRFEAAKSLYSGMDYDICRSEMKTIDGQEYIDHYFEKNL